MNSFLRLLIPKAFVVVFVVFIFGSSSLLGELSDMEEVVRWAGYGEEKLSTVVISGTIICNADQNPYSNPHPVSGAEVSVVCGAKRWPRAKGRTDGSGKFAIDVPSHLHGVPNLEKVCHVRVVHLPPTSPCDLLVGFTSFSFSPAR
ncbi:uncharacterized protein LOC121743693 isoform X2 [Salvia splendens]|uniref:uncharacterized protein LOC121743693 isoform X2 n=1 Tax=Salvia splendens TaxID=180675 RepID=UPI001C25CA56|nr:uncharacterized protein LOC121743693 isoform X2 [Salvia splendens]